MRAFLRKSYVKMKDFGNHNDSPYIIFKAPIKLLSYSLNFLLTQVLGGTDLRGSEGAKQYLLYFSEC